MCTGGLVTTDNPGSRWVGDANWQIFTVDESDLAQEVKELEATVAMMKEVLKGDAGFLGGLLLRNTASEVLMFAIGEQPQPGSTSMSIRI